MSLEREDARFPSKRESSPVSDPTEHASNATTRHLHFLSMLLFQSSEQRVPFVFVKPSVREIFSNEIFIWKLPKVVMEICRNMCFPYLKSIQYSDFVWKVHTESFLLIFLFLSSAHHQCRLFNCTHLCRKSFTFSCLHFASRPPVPWCFGGRFPSIPLLGEWLSSRMNCEK